MGNKDMARRISTSHAVEKMTLSTYIQTPTTSRVGTNEILPNVF